MIGLENMPLIVVEVKRLNFSFKPSVIEMDCNEFKELLEFLEKSDKPFIVFKLKDNLYYMHFFKSYVLLGGTCEQGDKRKSRQWDLQEVKIKVQERWFISYFEEKDWRIGERLMARKVNDYEKNLTNVRIRAMLEFLRHIYEDLDIIEQKARELPQDNDLLFKTKIQLINDLHITKKMVEMIRRDILEYSNLYNRW